MREKNNGLMRDLTMEAAGAALYAMGLCLFAVNGGFATGGVTGITLMINHYTGLPLGALTIAINVPVVLCTFRSLGRDFLIRSLRAIAFISFFTDFVFPLLPAYEGDPLLASVFTGLLVGAGMGIIYTRGGSTGGVDFVVAAVRKHNPYLSFGQITAVMDAVIILGGWPVYGSMDAVLYGLIVTFAATVVMDRVVNGSVSGKMALVVSKHGQAIADAISAEVDRGATLLPATGAYTGQGLDLLMCACSKIEIAKVRRIAFRVDPHAMVMICDAAEVMGEGFVPPETGA